MKHCQELKAITEPTSGIGKLLESTVTTKTHREATVGAKRCRRVHCRHPKLESNAGIKTPTSSCHSYQP